jgi:hypothetical protein
VIRFPAAAPKSASGKAAVIHGQKVSHFHGEK